MSQHSIPFRTVIRGYDPSQVDRRLAEFAADAGAADLQIADLQRRVDELAEIARAAQEHAETVVRATEGELAESGRDSAQGQSYDEIYQLAYANAYEQATADVLASQPEPVALEPRVVTLPAPPPVIIHADTPSYESLGRRVAEILNLAESEAEHMRAIVHAEAELKISEIEARSQRAYAESDAYSATVRAEADTQSARVLADARREAETLVDDAQRQALALRTEAESFHEIERAKAHKMAAEFETALAARRSEAERSHEEQIAEATREHIAARDYAASLRSDAEKEKSDAYADAARIVADAQRQAEQIVATANERATRITTDADREVAAAAARRESINVQLANVRTVLATLSGTTAVISATQEEPAVTPSYTHVDTGYAPVASSREPEPAREPALTVVPGSLYESEEHGSQEHDGHDSAEQSDYAAHLDHMEHELTHHEGPDSVAS